MAQSIELKATARERVGKGAARVMRRQGLVPGVIYGDKQAPEPILLPYKELWMQYQTGRFLTALLTIDVAGKKIQAIPRDVQVDPVRDFVIHVDFQRVSKGGQVRVAIPVRVFNQDKSPGLKRGGALNLVRHEIELYCPVEAIPDHIDVDMEGFDIGTSVHISQIKLPEGTSPVIRDRDFTVVTIAGAVADKGDATEAAAATAASAAAAPAAPAAAKAAAKAPAAKAPAAAAPKKK